MFYNPQANIDRINAQIGELEKLKAQIPNIQPITQNFQFGAQNALKHANCIEDVEKEYVIGDTPFFSNDLSVLWIKNQNGIRTFEIKEIVQKDEKDIQIEYLQSQIDEMREKYELNNKTK